MMAYTRSNTVVFQDKIAAHKAAQIKKKAFCAFCFNIGKPESVYTSHYVRETPAQDSRIVCPELRNCVCTGCGKCGHTISRCKKTQKEFMMGEKVRQGIDAPYKNRHITNKQTPKIQPKNIYSLLTENDSDDETETVVSEISNISSSATTENEVSLKSYAAALMTVLPTTPEPVADTPAPYTSSNTIEEDTYKPTYDFSVFKTTKRYASWADAESSDDEE